MNLTLCSFGARVISFQVPNRSGELIEISLGFDDVDDYCQMKDPYFGCIVGRVANRIAQAQFLLDGVRYNLPKNDPPHCLHGGKRGWSHVEWDIEDISETSACFSYESVDGEEGFPGKVNALVRYTLTDEGLTLEMSAVPDTCTPINMTNHTYFNLNGVGKGLVLDQMLSINARKYLPIDDTYIPTGEIASVHDTAFDFTTSKSIGRDIDLTKAGYDHTFVIDDWRDDGTLRRMCDLHSLRTGITLTINSSQPGIQFYSGNFLDGTLNNKLGVYEKHSGLALEPHHFPNSVNCPNFPSTIYSTDRPYLQKIEYLITYDSNHA